VRERKGESEEVKEIDLKTRKKKNRGKNSAKVK